MNSCDERIEKILNRAGQTISDLPSWHEYDEDRLHLSWNMAIRAERELYSLPEDCGITGTRMIDVLSAHYAKAVDIIDRFEWALENQVTLHENLMHVIGNADIPDGVSYDQFCLVVDNIYRAVQTAQEGWENYEDGVPKDGSVDDAD